MLKSDNVSYYWNLFQRKKLDKSDVSGLIELYSKSRDAETKCSIAILLSFFSGEKRIAEILIRTLKLWSRTDYSGWTLTTYSRFFDQYPSYRKKYLNLMFKGNKTERGILANSLFFVKNENNKNFKKILKKFIISEKDYLIRFRILNRLFYKQKVKLIERILNKKQFIDFIRFSDDNERRNFILGIISLPYKNKSQLISEIKRMLIARFKKIRINDTNFLKKIADELIEFDRTSILKFED
ncbi:hypothetical protein KKF32_01590 [Patescibacteria group bacterium]|nr:hypothetical protein [Patescibacteria group bacterium]